jgi:pyruvate/2-oxoglutarate dehydrogenase complex dihydrolipoamide acyltransferase (E2) component
LVWVVTAVILFVATGRAHAENTQVPPASVQAPSPPAAPTAPTAAAPRPPQTSAPDKPGFFHDLGRWWDGSIGYLHDKIKAAPGTFEDIGKKSGDAAKGAAVATGEGMKKTFDVSKDAATTIVRLPNTRVVDVHERCANAANGAPDCASAATSACRSKGFSGGKPLDSRTGEACPDTALASGKVPAKGECPLETVVLRAVCQ